MSIFSFSTIFQIERRKVNLPSFFFSKMGPEPRFRNGTGDINETGNRPLNSNHTIKSKSKENKRDRTPKDNIRP